MSFSDVGGSLYIILYFWTEATDEHFISFWLYNLEYTLDIVTGQWQPSHKLFV